MLVTRIEGIAWNEIWLKRQCLKECKLTKKPKGKIGFYVAGVIQGKHKRPGKPGGPNTVNVTMLA